MDYRLATPLDWPAILAFWHERGSIFPPQDPSTLGGHWLIAVTEDGAVHGTLWYFAEPPHAFVDFWGANGGRTAARLGAIFEQRVMREQGIRYAHGLIFSENHSARRLANGLGMVSAGPYDRVFKEVK